MELCIIHSCLVFYGIQIEDCILAILDATVEGEVVHNEVLEVDQHGHTPEQKGYAVLRGKSCIESVANYDLEVSKKN